MSETNVNKDTEESDQKKVTFTDDKDKEDKHDDTEEIDEEGKQKSINQHTEEDTENTGNIPITKSSDVKETHHKDTADIKSETHSETRVQDDVKSNDISEPSNESHTQQLTDDDKEAEYMVEADDQKEETDPSSNNASPSKYSLNSRSANSDVKQNHQTTDSEYEAEVVEENNLTDGDKFEKTKSDTSSEGKQSIKSEESIISHRKSNSNVSSLDKDDDKSETKKQTWQMEQSHDTDSSSENEKNESEDRTVPTKSSDTESKPSPPQVQITEKSKPKQEDNDLEHIPESNTTQRGKPSAVPSKQTRAKTPKEPERSMSPRQIVERNTFENRRKAQSARYPSNRHGSVSRDTSTRTSSRTSSRWSRAPSRPRTCGYISEERRRKEKEFFYAELNRLKDSLKKESKKIKKPKLRAHYPDVFTSLEPYYNTYTADYLINMPDMGYKAVQPSSAREPVVEEDKQDLKYTTRCTAIGLTDPWDSLNMDRSVLPKIEAAETRKKRMEQLHIEPKTKSTPKKRPEAKQGSTRLPKFPVIQPPNSDLTTKELHYGDVPMLRNELSKSFSHNGDSKKKSDYNRTKQDFYRMELDRMEEYHVISRPHMRAAYFAYLQNNPGSRKALYDCIKEMKGGNKKEEMPPQAVA